MNEKFTIIHLHVEVKAPIGMSDRAAETYADIYSKRFLDFVDTQRAQTADKTIEFEVRQ